MSKNISRILSFLQELYFAKLRKKMDLLQRDSNIVSLISTELEKLLDLSINLVQQLLKKQFPSVNGLQSTLLKTKPTMGICHNNQLQTIHSRTDRSTEQQNLIV